MEFPALMPRELNYYIEIPNEDFLFSALIKKPNDLVLFFETASDDETWAVNHEALMKNMLDWLTAQTFTDRLSKTNNLRVFFAIQKRYMLFQPYLPQNIVIKLKDGDISFNGLLLAASSDFFKQILLTESKGGTNVLSFPQLAVNEFAPVGAFISTGTVPDLPTMGQQEIIDLIKRAKAWELTSLSTLCERTLPKYLSVENILEMLSLAKHEKWEDFEQSCLDFVNKQGWGFSLFSPTLERLSFEFFDFHDQTLELFERFRPLVTDIHCSGNLVDEVPFGRILKSFSDLFGLDISRTFSFSFQFKEIPKGLQFLNLSECPWISKETLKYIFDVCPDIKCLYLRSDVHLNYMLWSELVKFKQLKTLDISNCTQLQDSDLSVILKGLNSLNELLMCNCTKINERGFLEIAKVLPRLIRLDLSRSSLSDTALVEIASRCRILTFLNISGCDQITEKGVLALVKQANSLQKLDISRCHLSKKTMEEIKKICPYLTIVA